MGRKQWILREQHGELTDKLATALDIRPVVAQTLVNRGITTVEAGQRFFRCDLADAPDPFLMLGMKKAVARIKQALVEGESIVVYGDYDADGQTATALLVLALRNLSQDAARITYYLPDRFHEGYGLNQDALKMLSTRSSLLITVDCGISSISEVEYANELGLDIIVTDHHQPGSSLPPATAILNPKQDGCMYPHKGLAGVGIAFKLVQALGVPKSQWNTYLEFVALGTVADLVPLQDENRTFVKHGLRQLSQTKSLGLRCLLEVANVEVPRASDLGFRLGPRLNAAGRLGDSSRGVQLLLTGDHRQATELAKELDLANAKRQALEADVLQEAVAVIENYKLHERGALVVWGENWHQGVVGIVASRLVEKYYLPTVVISLSEGQSTASARSIVGLDLFQTLAECAHLLTKFGGHVMAAGLSLPTENLGDFQRIFEELCSAKIKPEDYIPKLFIDGTVALGDITNQLIDELATLEPHGYGNPGPVLQTEEVSVLRTRTVGTENRHLQLSIADPTMAETQAIAFGHGGQQAQLERYAESVAFAFVPSFNEWRNKKTIQLVVKEWEPRVHVDDYVGRWMVERYPWNLGATYFQSIAAQLEENDNLGQAQVHTITDLRGTWDKVEVLKTRRKPQESTLILVNTPASALEVCRDLRIKIADGPKFIGFEHQLLTTEEREEFNKAQPSWLVSTGYGLKGLTWSSVWLWEPPLTPQTQRLWSSRVDYKGEVVTIYGPKDVRRLQSHIIQNYPDRKGLARIYSLLRGSEGRVDVATASETLKPLGILGALPVAMAVFSELGLWDIQENTIRYLPAPNQKLDLEQSVLYNKITQIRQQSAQYVKRSLERGFFQDGLKREN